MGDGGGVGIGTQQLAASVPSSENESWLRSEGEEWEDDGEIGGMREKFHNTVRENIIFLLFFLFLGLVSWFVICRFMKKREDESRGSVAADDDESLVYRICFWICVFSLSISIGGTLLLPLSILSNEVLLLYPRWYYVQWLNGLLVQGLWNLIFLFANISLLLLLPFAYFFIESEGFSGNKKGILPKVYETVVILVLAGFTVVCIAYVLASLLLPPDEGGSGMSELFLLSFIHQLPFIYSCISFVGVLLLLVSTPLGFARLFTVLSQLLVGPQFIRNLNDEILTLQFEIDRVENSIRTREKVRAQFLQKNDRSSGGSGDGDGEPDENFIRKIMGMKDLILQHQDPDSQTSFKSLKELEEKLKDLKGQLVLLEQMSKTPGWKRNLLYPLLLLLVLILTALAVVMVVLNTLQLLVGFKALPAAFSPETQNPTNSPENPNQGVKIGINSMSILGPSGAALEIILIFYLIFTSLVGLYNLPGIRGIRPRTGNTPTTNIIYNCTLLLITSSALPLLARILGITNFDLLGNYGKIQWLRSFYLVVGYNVGFSVASTLCLINKFTLSVRQEILKRLKIVFKFPVPFSGMRMRGQKSRNSGGNSTGFGSNSFTEESTPTPTPTTPTKKTE